MKGGSASLRQRWSLGVLAVAMAACVPGAFAEDPVPTDLDTSVGRSYLGQWLVTLPLGQREMQFDLNIVDLSGKIGATIDSAQQPEPLAIYEIDIDERGHIVLTYPLSFGQQEFDLTVVGELTADGMEGTISEASGLFESEFTARDVSDDPEVRQQRRRARRAAANMARVRFGEDRIRINFHPLPVSSEDHERLADVPSGEVFEFVGGRATKLFTDLDLMFGDTIVKTENISPNYPGVYSMWLKKTDDGWSLVFNEEADIWGTMHNPEADVAEVPLRLESAPEAANTFKVDLEQSGSGGSIQIIWGDEMWVTDFAVEGAAAQTAAAPSADVFGTWKLDAESAIGPLAQELVMMQSGETTFKTDGVPAELRNFKVEGETVTFDVTIQGYDVSFEGKVAGDSIEGNYFMDGNPVAEVSGARASGAA